MFFSPNERAQLGVALVFLGLVAEQVIQLTNSKSKIVRLPLPSDDPTQRQPNIELAKKMLEWEPKIQLKEGLIKTIDYFAATI